MLKAKVAADDSHDTHEQFRELANRYAQYAAEEGVRVRTYRDPSLPLFSKLNAEHKKEAIAFLAHALDVFTEMKLEGLSLREDSQLLWRSLRKIRMIPESDIFDKLTEGCTIEVYSIHHRHLFWNLRFLECFSLTLEQLLSQPWWELASRPQEIVQAFMEITGRIISQETPGTITIEVPAHILEELDSEELLRIEAQAKYISPLKKDGQLAAAITVGYARVIGSRATDR